MRRPILYLTGTAALVVATLALRTAHRLPVLARSEGSEEWFVQQRAFPRRELPAGILERVADEMARRATLGPRLNVPGDTWASIGPQPINDPNTRSAWIGRVTAIAVHPTDPNTVFLGSDRGGVWKTTNAGQTWTIVTPDLVYPAIRSLAIDPVNPSVLYAATPPGSYSSRLLRTTDGGETWDALTLTDDQGRSVTVLYKILIDPRHAGTPAVTTLYLQRGGWLYRSDDGGKTLRTVLAMPDAGVVTNVGPEFLEDVTMDPANPNALFVLSVPYTCTGSCVNPDPALFLYRSTDGGDHWTKRRIVSSADLVPTSRIVASAGGGNLLVAFGDDTAKKLRLMRSTDLGETWSEVSTPTPSSFAWPTLLALSPTADAVYLGNLQLNRSTNWGQTWTDMGTLHTDQVVAAFDAAGRLLLGSDGGMFRATTATGSWTSLNGTLSITECYSVAAHPTDASRVLIGTQDNGTVERLGTTWTRTIGGDGGDVAFDPGGIISYGETQWDSTGAYNFYMCTNGNCQRRVSGIATTDIAPFIPRFTLDPSATSTLYLTAEHLYRTDDRGVSWTALTPSVRANQRCWKDSTAGEQCASASYFTAVAVAPSSSKVVYAGARNGDVWVSTDRGANWKSVAGVRGGPLPVRPVNEIVVDRDDARVVYVVFGGFDATGAGRGHVFRSPDGGDTWRDLSGNLQDVNANALLVDTESIPRVLYLGTDFGVYRIADDGSGRWESFNNGMPPVVVTRFAYNASTRTLLAASYGRGVWAISTLIAAASR